MFNFQWTPNPVLQMSKKWPTWWEGYTLKNLIMNLKVNMLSNGEEIINIPFTKLSNFDEKIKNIENTNITATSIDVLPLTQLIGGDINMKTATFIKAYFIYKFCNIRNGDFFRSQADNLTKFGQTILSDKIINPSGLFVPDQDNNKKGNTKWIEYIYFNLYFTKNPNKPVENINFSFQTPTTTSGGGRCGHDAVVSEHNGGSKIKQYTKKNMKTKKYTRRNNGKKNKKTIHKYQNKKNKKTIRQRGGDIDADIKTVMNYYINPSIDNSYLTMATKNVNKYITSNPSNTSKLLEFKNSVDKKFEELRLATYGGIKPENKKLYKEKLNSILTNIKTNANPPLDSPSTPVDPTNTPVEAETEVSTTPPQIESTNTRGELNENDKADLQKILWQLLNYHKVDTIGEDDYDAAKSYLLRLSKELNNTEIQNIRSKIDSRLKEMVANPSDLGTTSNEDSRKYTNELINLKNELEPYFSPSIIKANNIIGPVKGDFSNILNYYVDPSISEEDLKTSLGNIKPTLDTLSIDELKNMYVLTSLRIKQLNDPKLEKDPSKVLGKANFSANTTRRFILANLQKKDKRFEDGANVQKLLDESTELFENPNLIDNELEEAVKAFPEFDKKLELKDKLNVNENIPAKQEEMKQKQLIVERQQINKQLGSEIQEKLAQDEAKKLQGEDEATQNRIGKDLVFDIVGIDFSAFRDTQEITETIVKNKMINNEINNKQSENEKLKTIFKIFMKKYNEYLTIFANDVQMDVKQKHDLPIFINTYLLLACYNTALREANMPLTKFNNDSWWFFTAGDFKIIANYLDIEIIIDNFNKLIGETPEVTPEVGTSTADVKEVESEKLETVSTESKGEAEEKTP
jgi:hypothetical protein